jgi:hypothetical protein
VTFSKYLCIVLTLLLFAPSSSSAGIGNDHSLDRLNSLVQDVFFGCHQTGRVVFAQSARRDELRFDKYFDKAPTGEVLRVGEPGLVISVAGTLDQPGWVLSRYITPDSHSFILQRPSVAVAKTLSTSRLTKPGFVPDTKLGIQLGTPISKVTSVSGKGHVQQRCGLTVYAYAWADPIRNGYNGVSYGVDRAGRIQLIESGFGCCGKGHPWDEP